MSAEFRDSIMTKHAFAFHIARPILGQIVQETSVSHERNVLFWSVVDPGTQFGRSLPNVFQGGSVDSFLQIV